MRRLVVWYSSIPRSAQHLVSAISTAAPFYFAAVLSYAVSEAARVGGYQQVAVHAGVFLFLFTLVVFVRRYLGGVLESLHAEQEQRRATMAHAYTFIDRFVTQGLIRLRADTDADGFIEAFVTGVARMQSVVDAAYATFESSFGTASIPEQRIDFEVTFMTRSYRDKEITIPAYANREGRAPRSLILRQQRADIYSNTVTATVYREDRPSVHIIEDTDNPQAQYKDVYPGQRERIRSSVVFPVLSETNELLGTLVVHCDRASFFRSNNRKYWCDLLEIFAKRIALEKAKLDRLVALRAKSPTLIVGLP